MSNLQTQHIDLEVVSCGGTPSQRGEQHGEALREDIAVGLSLWDEAISALHGVDADSYVREFVAGTDFLPAIRRWTPRLLDEVSGIARGANQPWEWIYAYNLLDEEWTWARRRRLGLPPGCTVAGLAPEGGTPVLAQTMDIDNFHNGTQAVVRIEGEEDEPDALVFTHAGMIGLTGCNSEGVAVVVNNLDVLPTSRSGLPVAFVIRGLLACSSRTDAVAFLHKISHATGQHYGLAGPDGLASVEAWATGIVADAAPGSQLLHTNHPLTTSEVADDAEMRYGRSRTRERLAFLEERAGSCRDALALPDLLADQTVPISLGAERPSMTFGAVIYECSVPPTMRVAMGPPHQEPFHVAAWEPATV